MLGATLPRWLRRTLLPLAMDVNVPLLCRGQHPGRWHYNGMQAALAEGRMGRPLCSPGLQDYYVKKKGTSHGAAVSLSLSLPLI